ncbi:MAG: ThiF family adenylyltransferase [Thermoplasmata archaeon]
MTEISERELSRYSRHILLKEIGIEGQKKLKNSKVVVAGCGALGCVSSNLLARAGVGKLVLVDRDIVEITNLQRQVLYSDKDVNRPKAEVAKEVLSNANPEIEIESIVADLSSENAEEIISGCNVVVDATDNMETRYLINDVCVKKEIPWVYGGAISTHGMTLTILPKKTACFRCFFSRPPGAGVLPTCEIAGVLNTMPSIIASIQATEAIKIILGNFEEISKELTIIDIWNNDFRKIPVPIDEKCETCKRGNFEFLENRRRKATKLCGRNAIQVNPKTKGEIELNRLSEKLSNVGKVNKMSSCIIFNVDGYEMTIFKDGRVLIKGTNDENVAIELYSKYIGI